MKASELIGPMLDLWVAKADVLEMRPDDATSYRPKEYRGAGVCVHGGAVVGTDYSPSTDWSQGGPIIEREGITVRYGVGTKLWFAHTQEEPEFWQFFDNSLLVAAMRCYVASKFGEEVDDSQAHIVQS